MTKPDPALGAEPDFLARAAPHLNVGSFRFWFVGQRWEWSDEVARMHGYEPGSVMPTTELLLSHKHPDDRRHVQDLLDHAPALRRVVLQPAPVPRHLRRPNTPLSCSPTGWSTTTARVVGTEGYYVDLTDTFDQARRQALDDSLPELFEARAAIEQAKGALMLVYRVERRSRHSSSCSGGPSRRTPNCGRWPLRSSPNSTRSTISRTVCAGSSTTCC